MSKAQYISPRIMKENVHRFSAFEDRRMMLQTMFTLLCGSCEVLGGDSDTETTTEVNIVIRIGNI